MTLRILHLSDLHLDRAFAGMGCHGDLARRRRIGLRDALRRAGEAAMQHECSAVTIGGDLYEHERADLETGRFLAETFASWQPLPVLIAPGNHDCLLPGALYSRVEWPSNVRVFREPTLTPVDLDDGVTVWGLAHLEPAWQGDPLGSAPRDLANGTHLALFHGAEVGSRPEGKSMHGPFRAAAVREAGFAAALTGHYHRRRLDTAQGVLYPGSPEPLSFDESGDRGPVLVTVDSSGRVDFQALALNAWRAESLECDLTGLTSFAAVLEAALEAVRPVVASARRDRTLVRLDLTGGLASAISVDVPTVETTLREATEIALVKVRDRTAAAIDLTAILAEPTVRGAFARTATAALERARDHDEGAVLADALRYGLEALAGVEVGLR